MTVRHVTLSQFERAMIGLEPKLRRNVIRGLRAAALRLETLVVEELETATPHPAVATSALKRSVSVERVEDGAVVAVTAPHAPMIENGTRPFFPPIGPLAEWALQKGLAKTPAEARGVAFVVARKIAERGIEPRHFFKKAWDRFPDALRAEIREALADAEREVTS
jgi:hypothetical protein